MTEKANEKAEKLQIEGILEKDRVIISDRNGIDDFYKNSYIGTLEEDEKGNEILILEPIEALLLCERHRILLWENNDKSKNQYDFESLLIYLTDFDERLWQ